MKTPYTGRQVSHYVSASNESFIGKQDHLELLWNHYKRARAGHASMVMVVGEPGIGKTYLLEYLAARAAQEDATILRGHASEAEGMPPYLPFLEALGPYIRTAPLDQLYDQAAFAPETLASILPELTIRLGRLPTSDPVRPEQRRLRLYEAIGAFLEAMSREHPLLLVLDDLHLADTESLSLLCYIAHHHLKARLLILGACREGEYHQNPALVRTVMELTHYRMLTTLKVHPLSLAHVESLALSYLGQPIAPPVTLSLHAQSEGNPLFVEELLQYWVEVGAIKQESGQWIFAASVNGLWPSSVINTLHQQLAQLCSDTIEHLRVAANIGRTFDISLLAAVEGQEVEAVEECLREAVRTRLVLSDRAGNFRFSYRAVHEYLYDELVTSRRLRLHGRIAQTLEARYHQEQRRSSKQLAELAFHFTRSGDPERGMMYAQRAAAQALRRYASQEIEVLVRMSLQFVAAGKKLPDAFLADIDRLPHPKGMKEEDQPPHESANTWLALFSDLEPAARLAQELGLVEWWQEALLAALGSLEHALTLVEKCPSPEGMRALVDLAAPFAPYMRHQPDGNDYAQRLLALSHCLAGDHAANVTYPVVNESSFGCRGGATARLRSLERVLALIESGEGPEEATERWPYLAGAYYWMAEIRRSHDMALRWATCGETSRQPNQSWAAYAWLGLLHASQGAWLEAEQAIEQALSFMTASASPELPGLMHYIRGFLASQREDYGVAEQAFQALLSSPQNNAEAWFFCAPLLNLTLIGTEKRDEATRYREKLQELLTRLPTGTLPTLPIMLALALIAVALGEQEQALTLYEDLLPFQGQHCWFLVDRVLGAIATGSGNRNTAATHLARAEAIARREGLLPELARTLVGWADLELAWGKEDSTTRANKYLTEALVLFEKLSMHNAVRVLRKRFGLALCQPDEMRALPLPAGLTRREVTVLRLVAEGKRNHHIAQEMCLSEKTVANHLTTIFYKTASENRAAAAAFAIRHGLA